MKAKKSHSPPSESCRSKNAGGITQLKAKDLRSRVLLLQVLVWKPQNQEHGCVTPESRKRQLFQLTKGERICLSILLGFPMDWMMPTCIGKRDLYLNTFTDTLRTSVLPIIWAFLSPGRLTHTICYQRDCNFLMPVFPNWDTFTTGLQGHIHKDIYFNGYKFILYQKN